MTFRGLIPCGLQDMNIPCRLVFKKALFTNLFLDLLVISENVNGQ